MQEGGRGVEGVVPIGKGWVAGETGIEEVRQARKEEARQRASV